MLTHTMVLGRGLLVAAKTLNAENLRIFGCMAVSIIASNYMPDDPDLSGC